VEWNAMADCNGCKQDREKQQKTPRKLTKLPTEVTQDKVFNRKGLSVGLCEYCDGDALGQALVEHDKRMGSDA
jgi:hypothetical protein